MAEDMPRPPRSPCGSRSPGLCFSLVRSGNHADIRAIPGGWHSRRPPLLSSRDEDYGMTEVKLSDEDSLERALKLFKRKLQKSGLFGELRRRRHYVKPSEARAIKTAAALRRKRKKKVTGDAW